MICNTTNPTSFDPALNMARQSLYRLCAVSLLDPRAGAWEQLSHIDSRTPLEAAAFLRQFPHTVADSLGLGERPLAELNPEPLFARLPGSAEELNDVYERTFGLLVSNACPPYESEYIDSKYTFQRSNTLADVSGFYRAFGLTTSDWHPERQDHVVLELEFMAFLLAHERRAAELSDPRHQEYAEICRRAQARFLREHLAWWTPVFAKLLGRENPGGFYDTVGRLLAALIPAERALLGVEVPTAAMPPVPSMVERPEACEGCELVS